MDWRKNYLLGEKGIAMLDLNSITREMFRSDVPPSQSVLFGINHIVYGRRCRNLSQLRKAKMNASKMANILKKFQGWKPKVERKDNIQLWKIQKTKRKKKSMQAIMSR